MPTSSLKDTWKQTWESGYKRRQLIISTAIMLVLVFTVPFFFSYIEKRQGILINDWVLAQIPAHNMSVLIFTIIWGMVLLILIRAIYNPSIYITYCWTLILVTIARFLCILFIPLAPPAGLIPLADPITGIFYGHAAITKDLFFSGHTSTLFLIFLCVERRRDKQAALFAAIAVAILLLVQHIHYTIDIVAAPVIVYALYSATRFVLYKRKQREHRKQQQQEEVLEKAYSSIK
jgi:hypothetical protein